MTQRHSPAHPKEAVVRVFSEDGRFFGTGCLEASGLIVTCAHVVRGALGLNQLTADSPPGKVGIDFPFLEGLRQKEEAPHELPFFAEVAPGGWGPSAGIQAGNDVAILGLGDPPPFRCGCIFPDCNPGNQDVPVYVHGFRGGRAEDGETVDGKIAATGQGPNGLWVFDSENSAYVVNAGFSGAPLPARTGWAASSAVGVLIGEPEKGPSKNDPLRGPKRVAFIIPAKRIHALIEAVYKAEAEQRAQDAPEELALARAFIPAARASLENLRNLNSATHFMSGVSRLLDHFETIAGEMLDDANLARLSGILRNLERQNRKAEDSGFADRLTLFSLASLCGKLGGFAQRLRELHPSLAGCAIPNDPLNENRLHRNELEELKAAVEDRLRALDEALLPIAPELLRKARNALWEVGEELDLDPLDLRVLDDVRRRLEELDRSIFHDIILATELLLGRYANKLPPGAVFRDGHDCPELVVIPPGTFLMGSPPNEPQRSNSEGPQHDVIIPNRFAVGRYPVTFEEWDAAFAAGGVNHNPEDHGWGRGRRPVINVSWEGTQAYLQWLTQKTARAYRLPSEAEWEYACRAGTTTPFWWGSSITPDQANYDGNYSYDGGGPSGGYRRKTLPVDNFGPNPFGLYQAHGNVDEWCEDDWHNSYKEKPPDLKATGGAWVTGDNDSRVVRGGAWSYKPQALRSASRNRYNTVVRNYYLGFRVARTLAP